MPTQSRPINSGQRRSLGLLAIPGHLSAMHMGRRIVNMDAATVHSELARLIDLRNRTRRNINRMISELEALEAEAFRNFGHIAFDGRIAWTQRLILLMDEDARFSRTLVHLMQEQMYRNPAAIFEADYDFLDFS